MDELTGKDGYELWLRYRQAMQVVEEPQQDWLAEFEAARVYTTLNRSFEGQWFDHETHQVRDVGT